MARTKDIPMSSTTKTRAASYRGANGRLSNTPSSSHGGGTSPGGPSSSGSTHGFSQSAVVLPQIYIPPAPTSNPTERPVTQWLRKLAGIAPHLPLNLSSITDRGPNRRPGAHLPELIAIAIESSPTRALQLGEIHSSFMDHFEYYRVRGRHAPWAESVRHALSFHSRFVRVPNHEPLHHESTKGELWTVIPRKGTKRPRKRKSRKVAKGDAPESEVDSQDKVEAESKGKGKKKTTGKRTSKTKGKGEKGLASPTEIDQAMGDLAIGATSQASSETRRDYSPGSLCPPPNPTYIMSHYVPLGYNSSTYPNPPLLHYHQVRGTEEYRFPPQFLAYPCDNRHHGFPGPLHVPSAAQRPTPCYSDSGYSDMSSQSSGSGHGGYHRYHTRSWEPDMGSIDPRELTAPTQRRKGKGRAF